MIYWKDFNWDKINHDIYYSNHYHDYIYKFIITFDTEVASLFRHNGEWVAYDYEWRDDYVHDIDHASIVYIWQLGIDHWRFYGRTLDELKEFIDVLNSHLEYKAIGFVHNLAYDFQMTRGHLDYTNVFARKPREPLKCELGQIELRCSYMLTRKSLDNAGKNYTKLKKLVGELDYNVVRYPHTKMTRREKLYCEYDLAVLQQVVQSFAIKYGGVGEIPLTQTGEVRHVLKRMVRGNDKYLHLCQKLVPSVKIYKMLKEVFSGGDTHASCLHQGYVMPNVKSKDFSSAHPSHWIFDKFPMTTFCKVRPPQFVYLDKHYPMDKYAYLINVTFSHMISKNGVHTYISAHKCKHADIIEYDNGRVYEANTITITCTEIDLQIISWVYDYNADDVIINEMYISEKDYLPKPLIDLTLLFYRQKTELKGVEGMESEYMNGKQQLNGIYGMSATDNMTADITYDTDWHIKEINDNIMAEKLDKMRKSRNTNLAYQWGVWTPLYTRLYLWEVIKEIGIDEIYHDTDCVHHVGDYDKIFEDFNKKILKKIYDAEEYWNVPHGTFTAKDKNGHEHPIGIFEAEPNQKYFKTLGAKKYCLIDEKDKLHITVSGVNKKSALATTDKDGKAIKGTALTNINQFKDGFVFDIYHSGRKIREYIDTPVSIEVDGYKYTQNTGIVLYPTTYTLGVTDEYQQLCDYVNSCEHFVKL